MILYHGSKYIIKNPEFGKGNSKNDYGLGFYCTESLDLAKEWACTNNDQNGFANKYELDVSNLKILDLRTNDFSILNWIAILLNNRTFDTNNIISKQAKQYLLENFLININGYDVIIGYRADDSYYSFAKDYINNVISTQQLEKAMKLGNLGNQVVLKTQKAFDSLNYIDSEIAEAKEYYVKRIRRDQNARDIYFNDCRLDIASDGLYILDIIRRGLQNDSKNK